MVSRPTSPQPELVESVIRLLIERPRSLEELAAAMVAQGPRLGPDPEEGLEELFDDAVELRGVASLIDGDRLFWAPEVLRGTVFTHCVTEDEVRHDLLLASPDLLPLGLLVGHGESPVLLSDGSELRSVFASLDVAELHARGVAPGAVEDEVWLLEPGWLSRGGIVAGDVIELEVDDGTLMVRRSATASFDELAMARARSLLHDLVLQTDADDAVEIDVLVATAITTDPDVFRTPLPPVGALLEADGFTIQGDFLCPPGVDLRARRNLARVQRMETVFGLERGEAETVLVLSDLVSKTRGIRDALLGDSDVPLPADLVDSLLGADASREQTRPVRPAGGFTVRQALDRLAEPHVAEAAAAEILGVFGHDAAALELTAELLEPMVARQARPAVRWLRAKAQERDGRVLDAEASLEAAYALDPGWVPVLHDLARFASDRGDAERGLSLLQRADVDPEDHLLETLQEHRATDRDDLGRNDPCWCGSGRRYKACHRGRERLALPDRAGWLYAKAWMHLMDGRGRLLLLDVARAWTGSDDQRALLAATGEDRVIDATLFEGGVFADFVDVRGALLPDDERLLAEQWLMVERSVHEIETVRRDQGFRCRDIRTGDRHEVTEQLATRQLSTGDLILARLVPDGRDTVIFGAVELVDLARRDMLVALLDDEPDAVELVEFLRAMHAPPTLVNADGGDLVLCEAKLLVADPRALAVWLDRNLVPAEGGAASTRTWHDEVEHAGGTSVRATVTLTGDQLTVFAMDEDRFDTLLDTLTRTQPGIRVVDESRRTMEDLDRDEAYPLEPPAPVSAEDNAILTNALHDLIRGFEQRWLDESVPALGGATPRQAAADPTRRDDLIRLLDSFPDGDDPSQMSATRLRAALGLT